MKSVNLLNFYLKAIRDTGLTNMWDSKTVQYYAFHLGFYELVNYIEDGNQRYGDLLTMSDYDKIPSFEEIKYYKEQLEEENIQEEVRELVFEKFKYLFDEFKGKDAFKFYSLDIDLEEIKKGNYYINQLINNKKEIHPMCYQIKIIKEYLGLRGDFYLINGGIYSTDVKDILSVDEWKEIKEKIPEYAKINDNFKEEYKLINERYRIKEILNKK